MSFSPKLFSKAKYSLQYVPKYAKEYFQLMNWKKNCKILDIGTGPGNLLYLVEPLFPRDYSEIICTDKSEEMVNYFNSANHDPRMKAVQMDIETTNIPSEFKCRFDFIFSCNVLMYLSDIRQTFRNISQMLNRDGELFFIFSKRCDLHDFYKSMSRIEKWAPYMKKFENWNTYFDVENPTSILKTELERVGIEVLKSEEIDLIFEEEGKQNFIDVFDSLDGISHRIPNGDIQQYKDDFHKTISRRIGEREDGDKLKYSFDLGSLAVAARKKNEIL